MSLFSKTALVSCALFLAGCAAKPINLTKDVKSKVASTEVVLSIPQSSLTVSVPTVHTGQGGLIGAIVQSAIEAKMRSKAEENAKPILAALADFEFRTAMQESANTGLAKVTDLKLNLPVKFDTFATDTQDRIYFDTAKTAAVLIGKVYYRLESGVIVGSLSASIYPKAKELNAFRGTPSESNPLDDGNAIYRKTFSANSAVVTPENVKEMLKSIADSLTEQLVNDLSHGV